MTTTGTATGRRSALIALAVTCAILLVVLYVVAVRTGFGQRIDNAALEGRTTDRVVQRAVDRTLDSVSVTSIVLATVALMVLALLRKRPLLAVGIGVLVVGANLTTQVLKNGLDRPNPLELGAGRIGMTLATFPSGHSTVSMSLALALVLAVPARLRVPVGNRGHRVRRTRWCGDAHGRVAPAERRARRVPRHPHLGGGRLRVARRAPPLRRRAT